MPLINKNYIIEERKKIIFSLKSMGYNNAIIAQILFRTEKSNITRFFQKYSSDFKKYILENK